MASPDPAEHRDLGAGLREPARVAEPGEGISAYELGLAARNHGMPLEALRCDVTPLGLHYLLTHFDIPWLDAASWRLRVDGLVRAPLELDLDWFRSRPATTVRVTMECAGNGRARLEPRPVSQPWLLEAVGTAEWTGVALADVLAEAGVDPQARELVFTGADHGIERGVEQDYQRGLTLDEARRPDVLLAYQVNGVALPPQHGFPLRLVVPGWYGMTNVKWLRSVTAVAAPFTGYQNATAYRLRQDAGEAGEPVTRIAPRALLTPPGFPDYLSRTRVVEPGPVRIDGRAWSGRAPVTSVEFSADGGSTWTAAELDEPSEHRYAWRAWRCVWTATPGEHILCARAGDASGAAQPLHQAWNRGGFANNAVQLVPTICRPAPR